jgi:exopolyphosphatase / guanosine-5'-triphosphate,3'-diphosphate pyrophosphatase
MGTGLRNTGHATGEPIAAPRRGHGAPGGRRWLEIASRARLVERVAAVDAGGGRTNPQALEDMSELRSLAALEGELGFPLRAACLDIGSNAMRFVTADFALADAMTVVEQERAAVRLGHDVFLTGRLTAAAMDAAAAAIAAFATRMRELEVAVYRAVATSAVREAANGAEFVARVREQAGVEIEVISGSEEARLVHAAITRAMPLGDAEWIVVDVGGGSVEVLVVDDTGVRWSESHTMGSVRLLEELSGAAEEPGRFRRLLEQYTATLRLPPAAGNRGTGGFIATGGNAEALATLAGATIAAGRPAVIRLDRLRAIIETLSQMSYRQRVEQLGLREDRADVVLPAALVYERLALLASAVEVVVPGVGIKEGVLFDLAEAVTTQRAHQDRQVQDLTTAAVTFGRRFSFDESHAHQVMHHALAIFDQLTQLHGLGDDDRRVLIAAALLHDIGAYISYKRHHKHSHYLIAQAELAGLSSSQTGLAAIVARYHRKSEPAPHHEEFAALKPAEQDRATKLAAILRLADALDREHAERVRTVRVAHNDDVVTLHIEGDGDLLLERWALTRKAAMFENVFKVRVKVRDG